MSPATLQSLPLVASRPNSSFFSTPARLSPAANEELDPYAGDRSFVMSLARGVSVLQAFSQVSGPVTLSEISRRIHIPRTAVRRLLYTLCELGYVRTVDARYALTPKSLELGAAFTSSSDFILKAQPIVTQLSMKLRAFCALSVQQNDQSMLACAAGSCDVATAKHRVPVPGTKVPLYASASGLIFLSELTEADLNTYLTQTRMSPITYRTQTTAKALRESVNAAKAKGYATCDQTVINNVCAIAVPVTDINRKVVAAMVTGIAAGSLTEYEIQSSVVPTLKVAARQIGLHWY